jgi:hypothetical protein
MNSKVRLMLQRMEDLGLYSVAKHLQNPPAPYPEIERLQECRDRFRELQKRVESKILKKWTIQS